MMELVQIDQLLLPPNTLKGNCEVLLVLLFCFLKILSKADSFEKLINFPSLIVEEAKLSFH